MITKRGIPALLIAGSMAVACGSKSASVPLAPSAPPPASVNPDFPRSFRIAGNHSLTAIGQTSQLTATAIFVDGIKDITNDAHWISRHPAVATVSSGGLLTAVGFGRAEVGFSYPNPRPDDGVNELVIVTVTPAGTFIVFGNVAEPGHGQMPNVPIAEMTSGRTTITDADGRFSFTALTEARLRFSKDGYETVEMDLMPADGSAEVAARIPMQRMVRFSPSEAVGGSGQFTSIAPEPLHNNDVAYIMANGQRCQPCRLIHIDVSSRGTLHLKLTWIAGMPDLDLWVGSQRFLRSSTMPEVNAAIPVSSGEVVVYAGTLANREGCCPMVTRLVQPFTLAAAVMP